MLAIRRMILTRLIGDLIKEKGAVTVDSERGYDPAAKRFARGDVNVEAAVNEALEFDEVHLMIGEDKGDGYESFVYVIFGNGNCDLDMISDYSTSLEPIVQPIMELIEGLENGTTRLVMQ